MRLGFKKLLFMAAGFLAFGLGWLGVFLPGLPTTIFWILAALAFMRSDEAMYRRVLSHRRFGPGIRLFVEEGRISARGKRVSIAAMLVSAGLGALAIPPLWVKLLVLGAALCGALWVASLPTPEAAAGQGGPEEAAPEGEA